MVFAGVGRPESASSDTTPPQTARSITVSGSGTVSATPTRAVFDFGVSTRGKTAVQALADDSAQMRKLIAALEGAGIPPTSLQTSSVSLSPVTSDDGSAIVGYTASNSVVGHDRRHLARRLDRRHRRGRGREPGRRAEPDRRRPVEALRVGAQGRRRRRAREGGRARGCGWPAAWARSTSIEENGSSGPIPFADAKAAAEPTPIQAGTSQITANVTVVFEGS